MPYSSSCGSRVKSGVETDPTLTGAAPKLEFVCSEGRDTLLPMGEAELVDSVG